MKQLLAILLGIFAVMIGAIAVAWWQGAIALPFGPQHHDLALQLHDRGAVGIAGGVPFGLPRSGTPLVTYDRVAPLHAALHAVLNARDADRAAEALRQSHLDGLLVRTDRPVGPVGSVVRALSDLRPVRGMGAEYLDDTAALYEPRDPIVLDPGDAPRLIEVVRLIFQGAVPPPERLFPPSIRRAYPTEVAVILRDGHDPILWRAVRGGSIARALVDATYAVLDRWNTRQQQRYGALRDAILTHAITVAVFYDRGTLGARTPEFLRRAVDPRRFAIGYERLGNWEYVLPPTPWSPMTDPAAALQGLAREHNVPAPGYLRPDITLYRFRAFQLIERDPGGAVDVFDPA